MTTMKKTTEYTKPSRIIIDTIKFILTERSSEFHRFVNQRTYQTFFFHEIIKFIAIFNQNLVSLILYTVRNFYELNLKLFIEKEPFQKFQKLTVAKEHLKQLPKSMKKFILFLQ
jgi:hypothetical protein